MSKLIDPILRWRAADIIALVSPHIGDGEQVLDIGSGTGHNAQRLRQTRSVTTTEVDVVDMSTTGDKPVLYDGSTLPFPEATFDTVLMIYMLHYLKNPMALLREAGRVARKRVIVVQTTAEGRAGVMLHRLNEALFGPLSFYAARLLGQINPVPCSMRSCHDLSAAQLRELARKAGLRVTRENLELYAGFLPLGRFSCVLQKETQC